MLRLGVALALTLATVASAQTYTVLKSFTGSDGAQPNAGLVLVGSTLYGTTAQGGSSSWGTVFQVNTDGSGYSVLKNFTGSDGLYPEAGLALGGSTLYGTACWGGSSGEGVVFKVNADGSGYSVLKNFTTNDAQCTYAGLALAGSTLYGTVYGISPVMGGGSGFGGVFKVNTDGSGYSVLKNFTGGDGWGPQGFLVLAGSTLYGTTQSGGSSSNGVVFKVNTDGSDYAVLKSFTGSDGLWPESGLVLAGSTLYGTTTRGGSSYSGPASGYGVVFKVNTDGSGYAVLKSFTGSDGASPNGELVLAGSTLFGTTGAGGSSGKGVVFQVNTDGSRYSVLKNFTGSDGAGPHGLVLAGGVFYGATGGGGDFNYGVVFSLACLSITTPPLTQTTETGSSVFFSAEVTNSVPGATYYQWYFGDTNALGGATNALLELTNVQPAEVGAYTVVVTSLLGAVTSGPALLSVIPPVERTIVPAVGLPGGPGSLLHLEYADSLVAAAPAWSSFTNVTLGSGPQPCFDLSQPLPALRFYRAWQTSGPQPTLEMRLATEIPLTGAIGSSVRVDYINQFGPTNAWLTLDTVTLTNSPQLYFDVTMFRQPTRLYRLVGSP
jgi:uncharacterized repeat protein (TIGR03803 family)